MRLRPETQVTCGGASISAEGGPGRFCEDSLSWQASGWRSVGWIAVLRHQTAPRARPSQLATWRSAVLEIGSDGSFLLQFAGNSFLPYLAESRASIRVSVGSADGSFVSGPPRSAARWTLYLAAFDLVSSRHPTLSLQSPSLCQPLVFSRTMRMPSN